MNNQHPANDQSHSLRNWRREPGTPVPAMGQQTHYPSPSSTNGTYQNYGPGPGQQYPGMPDQQYSNAPVQPPFPAGPNYSTAPGQPPVGSGTYQQYNTTPSPGPQYPAGPYQQYPGTPPPAQYPAGPYQPNQPNQHYSPAPGPVAYPASPNQQYAPPAQAPGSGIYQQPYQAASAPRSGQLPYPGGPNQPHSPSPQPPFQMVNNAPYQQYQPGPPGGPGGPGRRGRGNGWKVLFFVVPVVLVVIASIVGPSIYRNMSEGKHPLANIAMPVQATPTLTQQQLQGLQRSDQQMRYKQLARLYVSQMTLDEEIGQLMVVTYGSDNYSQDLDYMLNQQHVGGVIMYQLALQHQLRTPEQVKHDVAQMQQRATFPLFISVDEEGWNVDRLKELYPTPPNPKRLAADDIHKTGNPEVARSEGQRVARDMMSLGINVNFAPVVDVATNQGYIDWDYRAFGQNPDDVIKYSGPYLEGLQSGGVLGGLKHFVGLGAVPRGDNFDPHYVLPTVNLTPEQIDTHLIPFKHFIDSPNPLDHPGFIMPTDLMVPSIDPKYPTEFSHIFITDILRHRLGYDGVVITDGLQMGGVKVNGITLTEASASLLALQAGCDMLLDISGSPQVAEVVTTIKGALQDGTLAKARLDEAAARVITLKMERNLVPSVQGMNPAA